MKTANEWDEQYILGLPPGEHDWVEFKGRPALDFSLEAVDQSKALNELSRQVSAFANSGGGSLVYGVKNVRPGQTRTVDDGGVSLHLKGDTKEWLEDVIPNLVDLPLRTFNVYVVLASGETSGLLKDRGLFIISVADSESAPHQALDNKYYARVGGKSRPIGHKMVLDIIGRIKHPKIQLTFSFVQDKEGLRLVCRYQNIGRVYASYVNGFIFIPTSISGEETDEDERIVKVNDRYYKEVGFINVHKDVVGMKEGMLPMPSLGVRGVPPHFFTVTRFEPILPQLARYVHVNLPGNVDRLESLKDEEIAWEVFVDNAPSEKGKIRVGDLKATTDPSTM